MKHFLQTLTLLLLGGFVFLSCKKEDDTLSGCGSLPMVIIDNQTATSVNFVVNKPNEWTLHYEKSISANTKDTLYANSYEYCGESLEFDYDYSVSNNTFSKSETFNLDLGEANNFTLNTSYELLKE